MLQTRLLSNFFFFSTDIFTYSLPTRSASSIIIRCHLPSSEDIAVDEPVMLQHSPSKQKEKDQEMKKAEKREPRQKEDKKK